MTGYRLDLNLPNDDQDTLDDLKQSLTDTLEDIETRGLGQYGVLGSSVDDPIVVQDATTALISPTAIPTTTAVQTTSSSASPSTTTSSSNDNRAVRKYPVQSLVTVECCIRTHALKWLRTKHDIHLAKIILLSKDTWRSFLMKNKY